MLAQARYSTRRRKNIPPWPAMGMRDSGASRGGVEDRHVSTAGAAVIGILHIDACRWIRGFAFQKLAA